MPPEPNDAWRFLWIGYLFTVAIETPVLLVGSPNAIAYGIDCWPGIWLNACSYPIVVLVFPYLVWVPFGRRVSWRLPRPSLRWPNAALFWLAFGNPQERFRRSMYQDFATIVVANLASFLIGLWWF